MDRIKILFIIFILISGIVDINIYAYQQEDVDDFIVSFKINENISQFEFRKSLEKSFSKISDIVKQKFKYNSSRLRSGGRVVIRVPGSSLGKIAKIILLIEEIRYVESAMPNYHVYPAQ